jgi:2,5-furandicarboxylate decarboxylase 1
MPKDLRQFLDVLEGKYPDEAVRVAHPIDPARFEVTALLQHLENAGKFPLVLFENPRNLHGEPSGFPLASNVFATRQRCAMALDLDPADWRLSLSLEYARRESDLIAPEMVRPADAPVKQVVARGGAVDLQALPIVRHHEMDPAPYIDMAVAMRDPDGGFYNTAFLRNMYQGPRRLGVHMSPRHNWQIFRKYEAFGRRTPCAIVVSHHPAFYLGVLNVSPFGVNDYARIGAILGEPLRLTPSETWGEDFLVPADAEMVVEGEVLPDVREVEAPFGEFTGYYGPQRLRPVIDVTAVTRRRDAILQHIFVGHRDGWILGGIPKEGSLFNAIRGVVPTVRAVHFALSGCCRFNCYISIDKKVDGETKQAALIALGTCDFVKNVIVVDADVDVFTEQEVLWAVATRVQADRDVDILKDVKGNTLDPSQTDDILTAKMIVDATKPARRPFAARLRVPDAAMRAVDPKAFIPSEVWDRIATHGDVRQPG